jgi:fructose-specific phosphotransferase system component IIB
MVKAEADRIARERDEKRAIIRREIATAAMTGLLADHKVHSDECADGETCIQTVARLSVEHADALLNELDKPKK